MAHQASEAHTVARTEAGSVVDRNQDELVVGKLARLREQQQQQQQQLERQRSHSAAQTPPRERPPRCEDWH